MKLRDIEVGVRYWCGNEYLSSCGVTFRDLTRYVWHGRAIPNKRGTMLAGFDDEGNDVFVYFNEVKGEYEQCLKLFRSNYASDHERAVTRARCEAALRELIPDGVDWRVDHLSRLGNQLIVSFPTWQFNEKEEETND